MSEVTWTTMHIGGPLPADKIEDLLDMIDGAFSEMAAGPDDGNQVRDAVKAKESLFLQGQVNYGNPECVTTFCKEHSLTYWLHFDAGCEWDAGIQIWKPGDEAEQECPASAQGYTPTVDFSTLQIWNRQGLTLQHVIDDTARFLSEAVPPLTIVGEPVADEQTAETANG